MTQGTSGNGAGGGQGGRRPRTSTARGSKRERELARLKAERQAQRRAQRSHRGRRRNQVLAAVVSVAVVLAGFVYLLWPHSAPKASPTPSATPSATASAAASWALTSAVSCTTPPALRTNVLSWPKAPAVTAKAVASKTLTLDTDCGPITISLLGAKAPKTVSSMVFLAEQGYFDRTKCHRLTTSGLYVVQCGDPTATGSGGPGYTVPDENLPKGTGVNYPAGTVAMANSGPNTNGSQFFIVYADTTLGPDYTIWGKVTSGLDVARYVANQGVAGGGSDGSPKQALVITKATVS